MKIFDFSNETKITSFHHRPHVSRCAQMPGNQPLCGRLLMIICDDNDENDDNDDNFYADDDIVMMMNVCHWLHCDNLSGIVASQEIVLLKMALQDRSFLKNQRHRMLACSINAQCSEDTQVGYTSKPKIPKMIYNRCARCNLCHFWALTLFQFDTLDNFEIFLQSWQFWQSWQFLTSHNFYIFCPFKNFDNVLTSQKKLYLKI